MDIRFFHKDDNAEPYISEKHFSLFSSFDFFKFHSTCKQDFYFIVTKANTSTIIAQGAFYNLKSGIYISHKNSTFGGVELITDCDVTCISKIIECIEDYVRFLGGRTIIARLAPLNGQTIMCDWLVNAYIVRGWSIVNADISHEMEIASRTEFEDIINRNRRRVIKKGLGKGFEFRRLSRDFASHVYTLIKRNRESKGYPMTMSYNDLDKQLTRFPDFYRLFGIYDNGNILIAAAVCVMIKESYMYVLYWGDDENRNEYSPVTLLAKGIYYTCIEDKISWLSVGRSTLKSFPNEGLVNFKESLGFKPIIQITVSKEIIC